MSTPDAPILPTTPEFTDMDVEAQNTPPDTDLMNIGLTTFPMTLCMTPKNPS